MVIDLQVIRKEQTQALISQAKVKQKEEQLYFIQCLFSAIGIIATMIIIYFVGYAFL